MPSVLAPKYFTAQQLANALKIGLEREAKLKDLVENLEGEVYELQEIISGMQRTQGALIGS